VSVKNSEESNKVDENNDSDSFEEFIEEVEVTISGSGSEYEEIIEEIIEVTDDEEEEIEEIIEEQESPNLICKTGATRSPEMLRTQSNDIDRKKPKRTKTILLTKTQSMDPGLIQQMKKSKSTESILSAKSGSKNSVDVEKKTLAHTISAPAPQESPKKGYKFMIQNRDVCFLCTKTVYFAEKVFGPLNHIYHKLCLRCNGCNTVLATGSWVDHDGKPFCKGCYAKYFGPRGIGFGTLSFAS